MARVASVKIGNLFVAPKNWGSALEDPSLFGLVLSNLFTIGLALVFSWNVMLVLWVYWLQSVIIGFFNFFRILFLKNFSTKGFRVNSRPMKANSGTKVFTALFFAFHYGFFHLVYAVFLSSFTLASAGIVFQDILFVFLAGVVFFANHLFSFVYNKTEDEKKQNIGRVMFFPYARIVPMHLTIVFGGMFLATGFASGLVLAFFMVLKTGADIAMHLSEHAE